MALPGCHPFSSSSFPAACHLWVITLPPPPPPLPRSSRSSSPSLWRRYKNYFAWGERTEGRRRRLRRRKAALKFEEWANCGGAVGGEGRILELCRLLWTVTQLRPTYPITLSYSWKSFTQYITYIESLYFYLYMQLVRNSTLTKSGRLSLVLTKYYQI